MSISYFTALTPKSDVLSSQVDEPGEKTWWQIMSTVQNSNILRDWKTLARQLGVTESDITAITHDNPQLKEQCHQMLIKWRQIHGGSGATDVLIEALKILKFTETSGEPSPIFALYMYIKNRTTGEKSQNKKKGETPS